MRVDRRRSVKEPSLHRVQDPPPELPEVNLTDEYEVGRELGEGCFARILLATHRHTGTEVVLKMVHTELTSLKDFSREFHYSYHLSPHPNILLTYPVSFRAMDCYVFATEYAPLGDLAGVVRVGGLPETSCKKVASQLSSALEFLHSKQLVHRDIKLENILVFSSDLSTIKLCDFGETRKEGLLVSKVRCTWHPFLPPEACEAVKNERFVCSVSSDCWQAAIVLYVCLTGCPPWQSADLTDPAYRAFCSWQRRRTTKTPASMRRFSPRLQRLLRRLLEHKPQKRAPVTEISKYLKDSWLIDKLPLPPPLDRQESVDSYLNLADDDVRIPGSSRTKLTKLLSSYDLQLPLDIRNSVWQWILACDSSLNVDEGLPPSNEDQDLEATKCYKSYSQD